MKSIRKVSSILIIIAVLLIGSTIAFAAKGTVLKNEIRIRAEASTESSVLTHVYSDDEVEILEKIGDWYKVKYATYIGYISSKYVDIDEKVPEKNNIADETNTTEGIDDRKNISTELAENISLILNKDINLYGIPVIFASSLGTIKTGTEISILKTMNNWQYIRCKGKVGWVIKSNLTSNKVEEEKEEETPAEPTTVAVTVEEKIGYINASSANVRETASLEADVIKALPRNTKITILEEQTEWIKIKFEDIEGFVAKELISSELTETTSRSLQEARKTEAKTYYVSCSSANVRSIASTSGEKLGSVSKKGEVSVIGEEESFYKIWYNNAIGYILKDLLTDNLESIQENLPSKDVSKINPPSNSGGSGIVEYAAQFIGCGYAYGGTTPEKGFDCSGFTYYIYNQCGYQVGRTVGPQMNAGTTIGRENLELGDLVTFDNGGGGSIGHVGIYVGDGMFIHAANPSKGVRYDTLDSGYYYDYFYSGIRY